MRKRTKYSTEFKEKILSKALAPNVPSIIELARRAGVPPGTLNTWLYMNRKIDYVK